MGKEQRSEPVSIDSELFQGFRNNLDLTLEETLQTMIEKDCSEASITAKIDISLEGDGVGFTVTGAYLPSFTHAITSNMTIKSKKKGVAAGHYRMVYDETRGCWVCEDTESQTSFVSGNGDIIDAVFTAGDEEDGFEDGIEDEDALLSSGSPQFLLAGTRDGDDIGKEAAGN